MKQKVIESLKDFSHQVLVFVVVNCVFWSMCYGLRELIFFLR